VFRAPAERLPITIDNINSIAILRAFQSNFVRVRNQEDKITKKFINPDIALDRLVFHEYLEPLHVVIAERAVIL
jgi:hypothetical protein